MAIGSVTNIITKTTMPIHLPELDLANRKSNAVAKIVGRLPARSRTPVHHNSNKSSRARAVGESKELITAASVIDVSTCEWLPVVVIISVQVHRIFTGPILDAIPFGVRRRPMNTDCIHRFRSTQVDHDPLRMRVVGFTSKVRSQIRIAFPKRFFVTIRNPRIAIVIRLIDRVSASRQTIAIGDIDGFAERIVGRPVSALVNRITPRAARVPMPDFAGKLGSQPVTQWPKPS